MMKLNSQSPSQIKIGADIGSETKDSLQKQPNNVLKRDKLNLSSSNQVDTVGDTIIPRNKIKVQSSSSTNQHQCHYQNNDNSSSKPKNMNKNSGAQNDRRQYANHQNATSSSKDPTSKAQTSSPNQQQTKVQVTFQQPISLQQISSTSQVNLNESGIGSGPGLRATKAVPDLLKIVPKQERQQLKIARVLKTNLSNNNNSQQNHNAAPTTQIQNVNNLAFKIDQNGQNLPKQKPETNNMHTYVERQSNGVKSQLSNYQNHVPKNDTPNTCSTNQNGRVNRIKNNTAVGETGCSNDNLIGGGEDTSRENSQQRRRAEENQKATSNVSSALKNHQNAKSTHKQTTTINVQISNQTDLQNQTTAQRAYQNQQKLHNADVVGKQFDQSVPQPEDEDLIFDTEENVRFSHDEDEVIVCDDSSGSEEQSGYECEGLAEIASIYQTEEERLRNKPRRQAIPNPALEADMDRYRLKIERRFAESFVNHTFKMPLMNDERTKEHSKREGNGMRGFLENGGKKSDLNQKVSKLLTKNDGKKNHEIHQQVQQQSQQRKSNNNYQQSQNQHQIYRKEAEKRDLSQPLRLAVGTSSPEKRQFVHNAAPMISSTRQQSKPLIQSDKNSGTNLRSQKATPKQPHVRLINSQVQSARSTESQLANQSELAINGVKEQKQAQNNHNMNDYVQISFNLGLSSQKRTRAQLNNNRQRTENQNSVSRERIGAINVKQAAQQNSGLLSSQRGPSGNYIRTNKANQTQRQIQFSNEAGSSSLAQQSLSQNRNLQSTEMTSIQSQNISAQSRKVSAKRPPTTLESALKTNAALRQTSKVYGVQAASLLNNSRFVNENKPAVSSGRKAAQNGAISQQQSTTFDNTNLNQSLNIQAQKQGTHVQFGGQKVHQKPTLSPDRNASSPQKYILDRIQQTQKGGIQSTKSMQRASERNSTSFNKGGGVSRTQRLAESQVFKQSGIQTQQNSSFEASMSQIVDRIQNQAIDRSAAHGHSKSQARGVIRKINRISEQQLQSLEDNSYAPVTTTTSTNANQSQAFIQQKMNLSSNNLKGIKIGSHSRQLAIDQHSQKSSHQGHIQGGQGPNIVNSGFEKNGVDSQSRQRQRNTFEMKQVMKMNQAYHAKLNSQRSRGGQTAATNGFSGLVSIQAPNMATNARVERGLSSNNQRVVIKRPLPSNRADIIAPDEVLLQTSNGTTGNGIQTASLFTNQQLSGVSSRALQSRHNPSQTAQTQQQSQQFMPQKPSSTTNDKQTTTHLVGRQKERGVGVVNSSGQHTASLNIMQRNQRRSKSSMRAVNNNNGQHHHGSAIASHTLIPTSTQVAAQHQEGMVGVVLTAGNQRDLSRQNGQMKRNHNQTTALIGRPISSSQKPRNLTKSVTTMKQAENAINLHQMASNDQHLFKQVKQNLTRNNQNQQHDLVNQMRFEVVHGPGGDQIGAGGSQQKSSQSRRQFQLPQLNLNLGAGPQMSFNPDPVTLSQQTTGHINTGGTLDHHPTSINSANVNQNQQSLMLNLTCQSTLNANFQMNLPQHKTKSVRGSGHRAPTNQQHTVVTTSQRSKNHNAINPLHSSSYNHHHHQQQPNSSINSMNYLKGSTKGERTGIMGEQRTKSALRRSKVAVSRGIGQGGQQAGAGNNSTKTSIGATPIKQ